MTTYSTRIDMSSFSTDAKFRTWGSASSVAIAASGLTQTNDTGQINWSTVTRPTGAATQAGYEIWRFNDSLQATRPIYFRLDYGTGNNASGQNAMTWLTVGTGTNGSGTITGIGMAEQNNQNTSTNAADSTSVFVGTSYSTSAGACFIGAGVGQTSGTNAGLWSISRTCNSSTGAPDDRGVWIYANGGGNSGITYGASYNPPVNYASGKNGISVNIVTRSGTGDSLPIHRAYALIPNPVPVNGFFSYYESDSNNLPFTTCSVSLFGTAHTYLTLGVAVSGGTSTIGNSFTDAAVIWE